jgi:chromosome segregation ATPase
MKSALAVLLALGLGAAVSFSLWLWTSRARVSGEADGRVRAADRLQAAAVERAGALERENTVLRQQLAERGIEPVIARTAPARPADGDGKRLEAVRELALTQAKLASAQASVVEWQNKAQELASALEKATAEAKRSAAEEAGMREDLDAARRLVAATEGELKTKSARVAQLESDIRKVREDVAAASQKSVQAAALANELFDINRRRENVITSLQRRYREMTDVLRALAVRLDTQRDSVATAAPDISRMQSTSQSAEDDLRQLASLNTQAQRIAQKLGQK